MIKIGDDVEVDLDRLRQVRQAVGLRIKIQLDCNEEYRPDQAIKVIRKMEQYDPEFIEEPVKRWDIDGMARVAHAVDTPISSDESNSTLQSVFQLLEKEAADIINVKISKNGGLYNCRKIAAVAQARRVNCLVRVDNIYEITRQASRHLAMCTRQAQLGY